jgi:hypothetical protein
MRPIALVLCSALLSAACDTSDPLTVTLPMPVKCLTLLEEAIPSPPYDFSWYGDVVSARASSRIFGRLSVRGQVALLRLSNASCFTSYSVGPRSRVTPYANAFGLLFAEPMRLQAFFELLQSPRPAAPAYGLSGLRLVAPDTYRILAPSFSFRADPVPVVQGCFPGHISFADLIGTGDPLNVELSNASWPLDLARPRSGA